MMTVWTISIEAVSGQAHKVEGCTLSEAFAYKNIHFDVLVSDHLGRRMPLTYFKESPKAEGKDFKSFVFTQSRWPFGNKFVDLFAFGFLIMGLRSHLHGVKFK